MTLYLVRHGEATSEQRDPSRPLTDRGRSDAAKVAGFLKRGGVRVDWIWHSAKTRAIQTAEVLAQGLGANGRCEQHEGLSPDDPIEPIAEQIQKQASARAQGSLMLVGHLPFVQELVSWLLAGPVSSAPRIQFPQAGVVCLEQASGQGGWQVGWTVSPELLP